MKTNKSLIIGALAGALLIVASGAYRVANARDGKATQPGPAAMMMKMMNDRPKDLKKADATVQKAKRSAMKKGMYTCCLKHPCDYCALKMGACPCGKNAAMNMPVCNECKGGWAAGDGAIPGLTPDGIKTFPRMDMSGKTMGEATRPGAVVVKTCPMTGESVIGAGAGMSRVANYEVHFCCPGCKQRFDKLPLKEQLKRIRAVRG